MSKTIKEYYDQLNAVKASMSELDSFVVSADNNSTSDTADELVLDLTSNSKVANWRLWLWIFAVGSWIIDMLFDRQKADITAIMDAKRCHRPQWYAQESKKFQYGYALVWANNQWEYATDDAASRIVKYCAASEKKNGTVTLKVATEVNGARVPLTVQQFEAFKEFWAKWKDAGVRLEFVNLPADNLKIDVVIVRDRMVLNSDNSLIRSNSVFPIKDALSAFALGLEFDGVMMISKLEDAIQAAEGVVDVKIKHAYLMPSGGIYTEIAMSSDTASGYLTISQSSLYEYSDSVQVAVTIG